MRKGFDSLSKAIERVTGKGEAIIKTMLQQLNMNWLKPYATYNPMSYIIKFFTGNYSLLLPPTPCAFL